MIVFTTQAARGRKFRRFTNLKVATLLWDRFFPLFCVPDGENEGWKNFLRKFYFLLDYLIIVKYIRSKSN
jgi:hypothetical protein